MMPMSIDEICAEVLALPKESKEILVEKLVESFEINVDSDIERIHLDQAKRKRDEIRDEKVKPIPGDEVIKKVREMVKK